MMAPMLFKDREIVEIPGSPAQTIIPSINHFGIALDNREAQELLEEDLRVFGDEHGPYLVVRVPWGMIWPPKAMPKRADVEVQPRHWLLNGEYGGIVCWLKEMTT